jgi:hypothetical protein
VSTSIKSVTGIAAAWDFRNVYQLMPDRAGDPEIRRVRSRFLMAVIDTRWPTLRSSPWTRTQPHFGLSFTTRRIKAMTSSERGGLPGPRSRPNAAHFRRTSSRCHPSTVSGVTSNPVNAAQLTSPLSAEMIARPAGSNRGRFT